MAKKSAKKAAKKSAVKKPVAKKTGAKRVAKTAPRRANSGRSEVATVDPITAALQRRRAAMLGR